MEKPMTYKDAGVDTQEGQRAVELMKSAVKDTFDEHVIGGLGGFGGLFRLPTGYEKPVLVSGTDGVGTKLKLAFLTDRHDTIGQDLVAMCVNDVLCQGARPLFFLDYMATGKLEADKAASIVAGIAGACKKSKMALLGGETAEMPGFYQAGEYDLAGFCVGVADEDQLITGASIREEDVILGLTSSGFHSNGYSLVRKLFLDTWALPLDEPLPGMEMPLGEALLTPTKLYVAPVLSLLEHLRVEGIVHITGGGFFENIPRVLPAGLTFEINRAALPEQPLFTYVRERSGLSDKELFGTFNMGIGMVVIVRPEVQEEALSILREAGEEALVIGRVISGGEPRL